MSEKLNLKWSQVFLFWFVFLLVGLMTLLALAFYLGRTSWHEVNDINEALPRVKIDPEEYAGLWYEIARYPNPFEEGCVNATAFYEKDPKAEEADAPKNWKGRLKVVNTCFDAAGAQGTSEGLAYPTRFDGVYGVSFFPPFFGPYVVIYREPEISVVATHDLSYLWLLSRNPQISTAKRDELLSWLQAQNIDTEPLLFNNNVVETTS